MTVSTRYSPLVATAFEAVFLPWRRRHLRTAPLAGLPRPPAPDMPLVLVANHTSWWDGFLLRDVHRALRPRSPLLTAMSAAELYRHPFLRRLGAFSIDARRTGAVRGMLREIGRSCRLRPDTTIAWFPQGCIRPAWRRPLGFRRGIELLLETIAPCRVLPIAIHIEPLNRARPTAFVFAAPILRCPDDDVNARALEAAVTERLDRIADVLKGSEAEMLLQHQVAP